MKVIRQESYSYRDPVTEFIECLYVNFDFDGAQGKLAECDKVRSGGPYCWECWYWLCAALSP